MQRSSQAAQKALFGPFGPPYTSQIHGWSIVGITFQTTPGQGDTKDYTNGGYEFNLVLAGMALTLLIIGAGAYSLGSALGILW